MTKTNYHFNYPKVIQWLKQKGYDYHEFNEGTQIRIMTDTKIVDLWPGRMKYHIVASEDVIASSHDNYPSLGYWFDAKKLKELLES